jgi:FMN phosphatase YigB (HAD superfamily)
MLSLRFIRVCEVAPVPDRVVTFDFHNTIAHAESWFAIEIRGLPGAFLDWRAGLDGDLADPELVIEGNALYRLLRGSIHRHGHELTAEQCIDIVLRRLGYFEPASIIDEGTEAIMRASLSDIAPVPGVIDTIETLAGDDVMLGIVSSAVYHPFLLWTLEEFGVAQHFSAVTTSASAGYYKTRPEIYWDALSQLDADPAGVYHLGDSYQFDVLGSRRAGMRSGWYQRPGATPPEDTGAPDLVFGDFAGIGNQLLERLESA